MYIQGNELRFKASYYSVAKEWNIHEACRGSVSVNVVHTGDVIELTPCDYDGSAYIITGDIGVVKGDISLIRMLLIDYDKALYVVDKGSIAFRKDGKIYVLNNSGVVKEVTTEYSESKIYWFKFNRDICTCYESVMQHQTKLNGQIIYKYMFNFIATFSIKYADNICTTHFYSIDDALVRDYGLVYKTADQLLEEMPEEVEEVEEAEDEEAKTEEMVIYEEAVNAEDDEVEYYEEDEEYYEEDEEYYDDNEDYETE